MAQFEPLVGDIEDNQAQLLYLAAQKRHGFFHPEKHFLKNPISFPCLLDEDRSVTKAYGLYHRIGKDAFNIAHPATLVIDRARIIQYIYRGDHQLDRAPLDEIMEAIRTLKA